MSSQLYLTVTHTQTCKGVLCVGPGKKNKLRVYYLSWLRNKILRNEPEVEKRQGWTSVGDLEGCVHYKVGKGILASILARARIYSS